jgi:hypothetical protein
MIKAILKGAAAWGTNGRMMDMGKPTNAIQRSRRTLRRTQVTVRRFAG